MSKESEYSKAIRDARRFFDKGICELAIKHALVAQELKPDRIEPILILANSYYMSDGPQPEDFISAAYYYKKASRLDPDYEQDFWSNYADCLSEIEKSDEAEEIYQILIEKNPDEAEYFITYGEFLQRKGRLDDAIRTYSDGLDLPVSKVHPRIYANLADLYGDEQMLGLAENFARAAYLCARDVVMYVSFQKLYEEAARKAKKALKYYSVSETHSHIRGPGADRA